MERVSIISGNIPIILVAPHGYEKDDENTAQIVEYMAKKIKCYAVINRGWERGTTVDCFKDKADCNNVHHCIQDVVKEEFLEPILRFKNRIQVKYPHVFVFYIHGMSNRHKVISNDPFLDLVIGYGAGSPNSHTCEPWMKELFMHLLYTSGLNPVEGKRGGPMSAWAKSNMNQYFRKWHFDPNVYSMQVEISYDLRNTIEMSLLTAEYLATAIADVLNYKSFSPIKKFKSY